MRMLLGIDLGPHAGFIEAAYAVTALIIAALVLWVVLDRRRQQRLIADLEAQGIVRRSDRPEGDGR